MTELATGNHSKPCCKLGSAPNTDPAYSLVTECQQFSTYILISRGFLVERDMKCCGVTAGAGSMACEMFQTRVSTERAGDTVSEMTITKRNANWIAYNVDPKFDDAKHAIDDLGLTPGSIYVFDKAMGADTSKQGDGSHVWPIIRIDSENSRFQNLDFGATKDLLPAPAWASAATPIAADLAKSGTAGDWLKRGYPPGHACGLGIAPKADRLPDAVKHLRRARPVGMGRLAIQRRLPPSAPGAPPTFRLVYLSSFIRMWGDGPEDNYHATRFLLSLRSTPYFEHLQAYWFLYAPKSYLAYHMWAEGHRHY
ncbi:MAG: hypothetical protein KA385_16915, partial [Vicinamibacteria bacterium]|nr:hypothetical protein [Vicinamibacteria bacterium]